MSEQMLNRSELQEVIDFSQALWSSYNWGFYNPQASNTLLTNLTNNPLAPNDDKLRKALADYKNSTEDLVGFTQFMSHWDMLFARTLESYSNMLAYDLQITCKNAYTKMDYQSKEYEEDKRRVYNFLDSFDYIKEFQNATKLVMTHGIAYLWYRRTKWGNAGKMKSTLQIMPQPYCKLTGYTEDMLLYDFNLNYFMQAGVDIDNYDPVFKKYMNNALGDDPKFQDYIPSNPYGNRDGTYVLWTQTSPNDGAFAVKLNWSTFDGTPFLAPLMKDSLRNDEINALQYDKDMISAYGILAGEIRLFDNAKSGTKSDQFAINPKTLGAFMGKVKQGLTNNIKAVAMPTENTKMHQFTDNNKEMYDTQLKDSAGVGSSMGRVVFSSDRMSNAELQYATEAQYQIMANLYPQYEAFLDFWVNKLTKKYKFHFSFDGCSYLYDRDNRFDKLMKLADKGIVLNSSAFASVLGMRPNEFDRSLAEGKYGDMQSKLSMLLNANTMKDGGASGAPRKGATDLTDSGEMSREGLED